MLLQTLLEYTHTSHWFIGHYTRFVGARIMRDSYYWSFFSRLFINGLFSFHFTQATFPVVSFRVSVSVFSYSLSVIDRQSKLGTLFSTSFSPRLPAEYANIHRSSPLTKMTRKNAVHIALFCSVETKSENEFNLKSAKKRRCKMFLLHNWRASPSITSTITANNPTLWE